MNSVMRVASNDGFCFAVINAPPDLVLFMSGKQLADRNTLEYVLYKYVTSKGYILDVKKNVFVKAPK